MANLQKLVWTVVVSIAFATLPARAEVKTELIKRKILPVASPLNISQATIQITGVRLNNTDKGFEIILETTQGDKLQPVNKSEGNTFIADISNAQLRLTSGNTFRQDNPTKDITSITVNNIDTNTVRLTVIGSLSLPAVDLFEDDEGLIFGVTSTVPVTEAPQPPVNQTPEAQAQQPKPEEPKVENQESENREPIELVVTGEQDSYRVDEASSATRTNTPIRDIPQSIQVIPREVLEDQGTIRVRDALQNTSGFTSAGYYQGFSEYISLRGFGANLFQDGIRSYQNFGGLIETADIERIEVLKGPASVLFGDAPPGGLVNLVSKQPLAQPFYSFEGTVGSYSTYRGAVDLSGPLSNDKSLLYRFNAFYENAGSFRDFVNSEL